MVCLDTGHHAPGTNIEFIVAQLLRLGKLGSFDFNSRFYADDDLIVGRGRPVPAVPHHVRGDPRRRLLDPDSDVAFMLDQCHNVEDKIPGQIRSVLNVQEMTARALLVDTEALAAAQEAGDVLGANDDPHGRVLHRRPARPGRSGASRPRPARRPDARLRRVGLPGARSRPTASAAPRPAGEHEHDQRPPSAELIARSQPARRPTRRTPTTPAATPRPRAPRPTRSPASRSSCCGSRAPAETSAR